MAKKKTVKNKRIKAHFNGQVIVPDEPLDLPTGEVLEIEIKRTGPKKEKHLAFLDRIVENAVDDDLPADLGYQHDHYLYGTPKKPEPRQRGRGTKS